jgi:hypothetical protein
VHGVRRKEMVGWRNFGRGPGFPLGVRHERA